MGVVYLGHDPRLGRSVAIKVLTSEADPQALGRFLREGKTVAALQHPHIAALFDVGLDAGTSYLVMERVEGETLAAAVERGPQSWKETARIGEQIASALAHAHALGVLHRDIKPGNIMLAPGRGAVLLDFGVAQRQAPPLVEGSQTESMDRLTRAGGMVGTLSYMSPEQLQSQTLDGRSDLFQLGVTLYEAAAGVHPFGGPTNVDVMHAILRTPPRPLAELGRVPPELARIVAKLLEKDPDYRYPDARALLVDLRGLERSSSSWSSPTIETAATELRRRRRWSAPAALLVGGLGVLLGVAAARLVPRAASPVPVRIVPFSHGEGNDSTPSFSPDGKSLVFASDRGGNWDLWVGLAAGGPPVRITDTPEVESEPAWSPDGSRVVFRRTRAGENVTDLWIMPALGGPARRLVENAGDPSWSADGAWIVYADTSPGWVRLARVRSEGAGRPIAVTEVEAGYFHRNPSFTPDGRSIVYNRSPGGSAGEILIVPADGGARRRLSSDPDGTTNISAVVSPDGRFVVHSSDRGGTVNLWRLPLAGGAAERITSGPGQDYASSLSRDGRRIAYVTDPTASRLLWAPLRGGPDAERLRLTGSEAWAPDASPDGTRTSFAMKTPGSPWRMSLLERDGTLRVVLDGLPDVYWIRFDPTGEGLLFDARFRNGSRIGRVKTDGTGLVWLTPEGQDATYPDLSSDGQLVAFVRAQGQRGEVVVRRIADGSERTLARDATLPRFSPDGRWLALARSRSYSGGVGVVALEGGEPAWLTSSGTWPAWLPDGREIAYADVGPDGSQRAFAVKKTGGPRRALLGRTWQGGHFPFSFDRDGSRLLTSDDAPDRTTIWIAELAAAPR